MPGLEDGWQTFLRTAGLQGPAQVQDANMGMPIPDVARPGMPAPNRPSPGIDVPGVYGEGISPSPRPSGIWAGQQAPYGEEEGTAPPAGRYGGPPAPYGSQMDILEAFKQNVLNPPKREHMTYPENTLAGLQKSLEIAATPTDYEKNRVYIGGHPYQQVKAYKDPATGETKFINKYKQPGFMEQVMKAMPASVSPMVNILNQPYKDAVADWEMKNKGLTAASAAESQMALAGKRREEAAAIPTKLAQGERALDIKEMDANTRRYVASLKDLPDSVKQKMVQDGKMSIAMYNAQAAYSKQQLIGEQSIALEKARQAGRITIAELNNLSDAELEELKQDNRIEIEGIRSQRDRDNIILRAQEAIKVKAAPGSGSAGNYPSQQKIGLQQRAAELMNQNPTWKNKITFDNNGFPVIKASSEEEHFQIHQALYGKPGYEAPPTPPAPPPPPGYGAPRGPDTPVPMPDYSNRMPPGPPPVAMPQPNIPQTGPPAVPLPDYSNRLPPSPPPAGSAPMTGGANTPNASPIGGQPAGPKPMGAAPGTVEMITPDGKGTRSVPKNQVEAAKRQGYKPIGGQ